MDTATAEITLMKPIRLEGRAAEIAQLLSDNRKAHDTTHDNLREEYDARNKKICAAAKETHDNLWSELNKLTNTSGDQRLTVDSEYADIGFAFMKEEPKEEDTGFGGMDALRGLLGG